MNLLLLEESELNDAGRAILTGRRFLHLRNVLKVEAGSVVRAGVIDGQIGSATVMTMDRAQAEIAVSFDHPAPAPLPITLILALPRPKVLHRVIAATASIGIKQIYLINSWRVEKSYWETPRLAPAALRNELLLGLEQGVDTHVPEVKIRRFFSRFLEELPELVRGTTALVAHPQSSMMPPAISGPVVLAVGPDGGFIEREVKSFETAGFRPVSIGERVLRVETAVPALIGRLL